jgi:CRP-like cAMP-binding protein
MNQEIVKKSFPFFESELRDVIAEQGILKSVPEGETLIEEDQYIRSFPIVLDGVIRVTRMDLDGIELLLYYLKMDERLERFFLDRYRNTKTSGFIGSHQDIASSLGTSREVISRLLKQMERRGLIHLSRNRVDYSPLVAINYPS